MSFLAWLGITKNGESLQVGDVAPDVSAPDEEGRSVRLAGFYHDGLTLVYFYPKADTPGCTAQACSLRDGFAELSARGVRVIGVSADSPAAQFCFKEGHRLPFTLLADQEHAVARAFGVRLMLGMPNRQSFLIRNGRIVWRDLHASTREQARDVLRFVELER
ncbi:MAG: peroxiredoxin [Methylacidiphilales bacterium]|nr:peroxiredoxin [Candidatus Methylacidiphilales bacterium]